VRTFRSAVNRRPEGLHYSWLATVDTVCSDV
jgi:hypothetical protein